MVRSTVLLSVLLNKSTATNELLLEALEICHMLYTAGVGKSNVAFLETADIFPFISVLM